MLFDPAVVETVRDAVPTWLGVLLVAVTYLGSVYVIAPALIVAYWYRRAVVAPWLGAVLACYGLMSITKAYHTASRPSVGPPVGAEHFPAWFLPWYEHAAYIDTSSFPSGHALAATVVVGVIVLDAPVSTLARRAAVGVGVVAVVGFTRIALGAHYPGDVLGGIAYGVAFLVVWYGLRVVAFDRRPRERLARVGVGRPSHVTLADRVDRRRHLPGRDSLDAATISFALALAVGTVAVTYVGSRNSHIVFGGAIGGLLAWLFAPRIAAELVGTVAHYVAPVVTLTVVAGTWFVTDSGYGTEPFLVGWAALFLATVILVPWMVSTGDHFDFEHTKSTG